MVASAADVSRVMVSRAFNPHASIKPEKRDRILKVAQAILDEVGEDVDPSPNRVPHKSPKVEKGSDNRALRQK